jgi:hypothetical protein
VNTVLSFVSSQAVGIAIALAFTAAIVAGQRIDSPTETDALQASADIFNDTAAQYAAQRAFVAAKD